MNIWENTKLWEILKSQKSEYLKYFERTWNDPTLWVEFGRNSDSPSGTNILEEYDNRLKIRFPNKSCTIHHVVDNLWNEVICYEKFLVDPLLLKEKNQELELLKIKFEKRRTLKILTNIRVEDITSNIPLLMK